MNAFICGGTVSHMTVLLPYDDIEAQLSDSYEYDCILKRDWLRGQLTRHWRIIRYSICNKTTAFAPRVTHTWYIIECKGLLSIRV